MVGGEIVNRSSSSQLMLDFMFLTGLRAFHEKTQAISCTSKLVCIGVGKPIVG